MRCAAMQARAWYLKLHLASNLDSGGSNKLVAAVGLLQNLSSCRVRVRRAAERRHVCRTVTPRSRYGFAVTMRSSSWWTCSVVSHRRGRSQGAQNIRTPINAVVRSGTDKMYVVPVTFPRLYVNVPFLRASFHRMWLARSMQTFTPRKNSKKSSKLCTQSGDPSHATNCPTQDCHAVPSRSSRRWHQALHKVGA